MLLTLIKNDSLISIQRDESMWITMIQNFFKKPTVGGSQRAEKCCTNQEYDSLASPVPKEVSSIIFLLWMLTEQSIPIDIKIGIDGKLL